MPVIHFWINSFGDKNVSSLLTDSRAPAAEPLLLDWDQLMANWSGARLKEIREAAGMNQTDLAVACDTRQSNISRWEAGPPPTPGADDLYAMADALKVSCDEFRKQVGSPIRFLRPRKPKDDDSTDE